MPILINTSLVRGQISEYMETALNQRMKWVFCILNCCYSSLIISNNIIIIDYKNRNSAKAVCLHVDVPAMGWNRGSF